MTPPHATLPAVRAPEFPRGLAWINTPSPLSVRALRGKIVLLDFWTHGCVNCQRMAPILERLALKYLGALVVVGVHSPKFEAEASPASVRHAAERLGISHPIVCDSARRIWSEYAARAWPTFVLVSAEGKVTAQLQGERSFEQLDFLVAQAINEAKLRGILDESPLQAAPAAPQVLEAAPASPLLYPGKVLAHEELVFVADSGHNRVVVARWDGACAPQVLAVAGSGTRGLKDGAFADSAFSSPQGMALRTAGDGAQTLFVADSGNHAVRALDLQNFSVSTVASGLPSPWDVALLGSALFVAAAGAHQIWAVDLATQTAAPWAGRGHEARRDGPRSEADLAQPSGLSLGCGKLFFADAESSSVRFVDLKSGEVGTLSGGDADGPGLFTFGDRDGAREDVLLQHPLAVEAREHDGAPQVLVADTYNHKLKAVAPDGSAKTLAGDARGDFDGASPLFDEPSGLSARGKILLVADTNNHKIKALDLETGRAQTLVFESLESIQNAQFDEVSLLPIVLRAWSTVQVLVEIGLPAGHHLSGGAPQALLEVESRGGPRRILAPEIAEESGMQVRFAVETSGLGDGTFHLRLSISYCSDECGVCKWVERRLRCGFGVSEAGLAEVRMRAEAEPERYGAGTP